MVNSPLEQGPLSPQTPERAAEVVQPAKVESLSALLMEVNDIISESSPAQPGEQWSDGTGGAVATTGGQQTGTQTMSPRDQAIANIPMPAVMQKQLEQHIRTEVKLLHKQAKKIVLSKPGAAHHLSELYTRIHKLNKLLSAIFEASVETVKRIFIRVFIDRQPIL